MSFPQPALSLFNRDFSPGYLDTPEVDVMAPGASPDAKNCLFSHISEDPVRVTIKKRRGHRLVTPTALSAIGASVDGMVEYRRVNSTQVLLAGSGGTLFYYDNVSSFTPIIAGFTAGEPMRFAFQKTNAIVMDGTFMVRLDPLLAAYPVGFAAPTAAPALAAVAGPGVTGTYEGFAVWYDPVTDHESSPSATSAAVVFANQQRQWTKPAGAPPANVTFWRVYVRRTDTNEANFFRAGTFAIAAGTGTEATSDGARVNIGPAPNSNDPPPGPFALMATYRGYAIGVLKNSTDLHFSKINDFESWNPSDVFKVANGKQEIRLLRNFGDQLVIKTPSGMFILEGDQLPFKIVEKNSNCGSVSQDASGEVSYRGGNRLFGWDEVKGPYWWDGANTWVPMSDNRVQVAVANVNQGELDEIRFIHDTQRHLVIWAVPIATSPRARTLYAYDYTIDKWLPPITGFEIGAFAAFNNPTNGLYATYFGDLWGRVYEMFAQDSDGIPPSGGFSFSGAITGATASTVSAAAATFYTGGNGMAGMPVAVRSPSGGWQFRRIQSNTATDITLDTTNDSPWLTVPLTDGSWVVYVGPIEWYWSTPWVDFGRPDRYKRLNFFSLAGRTVSAASVVELLSRFNDDESVVGRSDMQTSAAGGIWGSAIWGVSLWAGQPRRTWKVRANHTCRTVQLRFQNFYPNQPVDLTGYGIEGDWLLRRRTLGSDSG